MRIYHFLFVNFQYFKKIKIFWWRLLVFLSIPKSSLGLCEVPHKVWTQSVQPLGRLLDTNGQKVWQTDRHPDKQSMYKDLTFYLSSGDRWTDIVVREEGDIKEISGDYARQINKYFIIIHFNSIVSIICHCFLIF